MFRILLEIPIIPTIKHKTYHFPGDYEIVQRTLPLKMVEYPFIFHLMIENSNSEQIYFKKPKFKKTCKENKNISKG